MQGERRSRESARRFEQQTEYSQHRIFTQSTCASGSPGTSREPLRRYQAASGKGTRGQTLSSRPSRTLQFKYQITSSISPEMRLPATGSHIPRIRLERSPNWLGKGRCLFLLIKILRLQFSSNSLPLRHLLRHEQHYSPVIFFHAPE
jgi:hypothetical protein